MGKRPGPRNPSVPNNPKGHVESKGSQRMTPWARPQGGHGSLRGADSPNSSSQFEGLFGRMFRTLPSASFEDSDLSLLADAMTADPEVVTQPDGTPKKDDKGRLIPKATPETELDDEENLGIPAGFTYLGKFIDHDITFDPASSLQRQNDPEALVDFRTPRLDLDNLYCRGPADQAYMYAPDGVRFLLGTDLTRNGEKTKA